MNTHEIYWLAGFLEGEGSFHLTYRDGYTSIKIDACGTDRDTIEQVLQIATVGNICSFEQTGFGRKRMHRWAVGKQQDAAALMMMVYPLMSKRRKEQIELCLNAWRSYQDSRNRPCPQGHTMDKANMYIDSRGHRFCKICRNEHAKRAREKNEWNKLLGY